MATLTMAITTMAMLTMAIPGGSESTAEPLPCRVVGRIALSCSVGCSRSSQPEVVALSAGSPARVSRSRPG
jgi:hypothetical protein